MEWTLKYGKNLSDFKVIHRLAFYYYIFWTFSKDIDRETNDRASRKELCKVLQNKRVSGDDVSIMLTVLR